jgi:hypothetical protein
MNIYSINSIIMNTFNFILVAIVAFAAPTGPTIEIKTRNSEVFQEG